MMSKTRLISLIVTAFVLLLPAFLWAGTIQLPQTGQTKCYDMSGNEIACGGTGQDGEIRAGVAWPEPRFVDNGNGTITDNLTGLIWAKDASTPTFGTCIGGRKMWQQALDYVVCLNSNNYLGHNDWRLPNINELKSLTNDDAKPDIAAWLKSQGFNFIHSSLYWSSTSDAGEPYAAWLIYSSAFSMEAIAKYRSEDFYLWYVWPVRSGQSGVIQLPQTGQAKCYDTAGMEIACAGTGQDGEIRAGVAWPNMRFTDNGNGTITDNLTGLIWAKDAGTPTFGTCTGGKKSWQGALDYVKCLNNNVYLGYADWRVPNKNELNSLIDYGRYNLALPLGNPFYNIPSYWRDNYYWSSTGTIYNQELAKIVNMSIGWLRDYYKTSIYYVWPVRSRQVGQGNLEVSPSSHDFGEVAVGTCSAVPQQFALSNTGNADLNVSDISLSDNTNFVLDINGGDNPCSTNNPALNPKGSCTVTVAFCPSSSGSFNANLTISSKDPDSASLSLPIFGLGYTVIKKSKVGYVILVDGVHIPSIWNLNWAGDYSRYLYDELDGQYEKYKNWIERKVGFIYPFVWSRNYYETEEFVNKLAEDLKYFSMQAHANEGPLVVLAHSWGTVLSYIAASTDTDKIHIDRLITLGSPLVSQWLWIQEFTMPVLWHWNIYSVNKPSNIKKWHNYYAQCFELFHSGCDPVSGEIPAADKNINIYTTYVDEHPLLDFDTCHAAYYKDPIIWQGILGEIMDSKK